MGWWQNVDKLYLRDVFWWGLKRAGERRRQREALAWQEEKQRQQNRLNSVKTGLTTAAGVIGAIATPVISTLPGGQQYEAASSGREWGETRMQAERDRRSRDLENGTLDAGNRTRGTNQRG